LKKSSKKLLTVRASVFPDGLSPNGQKFFGSFFQKRTFFLCRRFVVEDQDIRAALVERMT
jgi:hypothetical protein